MSVIQSCELVRCRLKESFRVFLTISLPLTWFFISTIRGRVWIRITLEINQMRNGHRNTQT